MTNKKIIIGLTGQIACGKGVVKNFLIENYQANDYRFSSILRDVLKRLNIEESRVNIAKMSTLLRQGFSEDLLAQAMAKDVKNDPSTFIVIDGIRRMADIKFLKELDNFFLVSIEAEAEIRYQRVVERNENPGDDKKTWEDFLVDERAETEQQIPETMGQANFTINNNGSWDELWQEIHNLVKKINEI